MSDATKALRTGRDLRLEHRRDAVAQPEVCRADDAGRHPGLPVLAAGALGGDALHELGLTHHPELFGPVGPVHGGALDEDRLPHVVRGRVLEELFEHVPVARSIP